MTVTLGWSWRPNQPERGVLALTLDGLGEVVLQPEQSVTVRPGQHLLEVEVAAEVVHLLYRDEMHVDDAPADASVHCRRGAARLHG